MSLHLIQLNCEITRKQMEMKSNSTVRAVFEGGLWKMSANLGFQIWRDTFPSLMVSGLNTVNLCFLKEKV
jgi:hypothetical protein